MLNFLNIGINKILLGGTNSISIMSMSHQSHNIGYEISYFQKKKKKHNLLKALTNTASCRNESRTSTFLYQNDNSPSTFESPLSVPQNSLFIFPVCLCLQFDLYVPSFPVFSTPLFPFSLSLLWLSDSQLRPL